MSTSTAATQNAVKQLAALLQSDSVRNVAFLTGAGVSVGAGIPDFRSPGGMYDTLRPELLTATDDDRRIMRNDPTHVVNRELFKRNQFPYMEVRRPFIMGTAENKWRATITHYFMRLIDDEKKLRRIYTQNIDGLDFQTGIPLSKIIPVHGSMGKIVCELCGVSNPPPFNGDPKLFAEEVKEKIKDIYNTDPDAPKESSPILCYKCNRAGVKPGTVMYGGAMPTDFFECTQDDFRSKQPEDRVDLMIVCGTALTVHPAAMVPTMCPEGTPRFLLNRDAVGPFTRCSDPDYFLQGDCDDLVLEVCKELGWIEKLAVFRDKMAPKSQELLDAFIGRMNSASASSEPAAAVAKNKDSEDL